MEDFARSDPRWYEDYVTACWNRQLKPGTLHIYSKYGSRGEVFFVSFPIQDHWRVAPSLDIMRQSFACLAKFLATKPWLTEISMQISMAEAPIKWRDCKELIHEILLPYTIENDITLKLYAPGSQVNAI